MIRSLQDTKNVFADKSQNPMLNLRTGHIASVELNSTSSFLKLLPGKPVDVALNQSIINGETYCKFELKIANYIK